MHIKSAFKNLVEQKSYMTLYRFCWHTYDRTKSLPQSNLHYIIIWTLMGTGTTKVSCYVKEDAFKNQGIRLITTYDLIQILLAHIRYDENPCRKARTSMFIICTLKSTSTTNVFCHVNVECIPLLSCTQLSDAILEHRRILYRFYWRT